MVNKPRCFLDRYWGVGTTDAKVKSCRYSISVLGVGPPLQKGRFTNAPGHADRGLFQAQVPGAYPADHCSTSAGWVRIAALVNCFRMSGSSGGMWICCAQNMVSGSGIALQRSGSGWKNQGVLLRRKGGELPVCPPPGLGPGQGSGFGRDRSPEPGSGPGPRIWGWPRGRFLAARTAGTLTRYSSGSSKIEGQPPPLAA